MTEKVLSNKKNGMAMMILWIVLYIVALLMTGCINLAAIYYWNYMAMYWLDSISWFKSIKATRSLSFNFVW